jgi:hypothetical protein
MHIPCLSEAGHLRHADINDLEPSKPRSLLLGRQLPVPTNQSSEPNSHAPRLLRHRLAS